MEIVPPRLRLKIYELDQCFSGYSQDIEQGIEMVREEKDYVEQCLNAIYNYIESQYIKNERKLYCSAWKRMKYAMQDFSINSNIIFEVIKGTRKIF